MSPGGGGGSSSSASTYSVSGGELSAGVSEKLKVSDKFSFVLDSEKHTVKVDKITNGDVTVTVKSDPIHLVLSEGDERKLNLSSTNFYDFYIKVNSVERTKANITIQKIFEEIEKEIVEPINESLPIHAMNEMGSEEEESNDWDDWWNWAIGILVVIFFASWFLSKELKGRKASKK